MTVVDSPEPGRKLVVDPGPIERTARVLAGQAEAVAERTRLLVRDENLGNSFGCRGTAVAGSYRNAAEVFGDVAGLLRDELERGRRMLLAVGGDHRAAGIESADENR